MKPKMTSFYFRYPCLSFSWVSFRCVYIALTVGLNIGFYGEEKEMSNTFLTHSVTAFFTASLVSHSGHY